MVNRNNRTGGPDLKDIDQVMEMNPEDIETALEAVATIPDPYQADEEQDYRNIIRKHGSGTEEYSQQDRAQVLQSAGWARVWNTKTREPSWILRYMLPLKLAQRNEDNTPVFTTRQPSTPPFRGKFPCYLNPKHPEYHKWEDFGLPYCTRENLPNPMQQRMNAKAFHPQEWEMIQGLIAQEERDEDRQFQRTLLERTVGTNIDMDNPNLTECPECYEEFTAKSISGAKSKLRSHMKQHENKELTD